MSLEPQIKAQLEAANKMIFIRDYEGAEKILTALRIGPGGDEFLVHLRAVELATRLERLPELRKAYLRELKHRPKVWPLDLALLMIEIFAESTPIPSVMTQLQDLLRERGPHPGISFALGFCLESQKNLDRAIMNYHESITQDSDWYPSYFGLSQVYYQKGDEKQGDHFFYLFESLAPYNVYGNFETHRRLSEELLGTKDYQGAASAISTLCEWWQEHRGQCPPEIRMYERFALARIADEAGDREDAERKREEGRRIGEDLLSSPGIRESQLYFGARVLDEFKESALAVRAYSKILQAAGSDPALVQRVGGHFLAQGDARLAVDLFAEAYKVYPENPDIRFCLLVGKLRRDGVAVEEYLMGKERLRQLLATNGDKVEILSLLHALLAKTQEDPDIHAHTGDVYLRMGHVERAGRHYRRMFELDPASRESLVKLSSFLMHHGDPDEGIRLIDQALAARPSRSPSLEETPEILWIRATYYARKGDYAKSQGALRRVLMQDPWNVGYVVQEAINLTYLSPLIQGGDYYDKVLQQLSQNQEVDLPWAEFDVVTESLVNLRAYDVAYARQRIRYLYASGEMEQLNRLTWIAGKFDAARGVYDVLRLLNTNFDSGALYAALGQLFKELWQLETAVMWFEQALLHPQTDEKVRALTEVEIADCNGWLGHHLERSVELCKFATESGRVPVQRVRLTLAHCQLKLGQVQSAQRTLEGLDSPNDPEAVYLSGLLQYRNGAERKAREIWKPLLTVRSEDVRFHHIKQEILRFYFDKDVYLRAN